MAREKALYFVGPVQQNKRPARYIEGVPARDLSERDIDRLSDELYEAAVKSDLYQKSKPSGGDKTVSPAPAAAKVEDKDKPAPKKGD